MRLLIDILFFETIRQDLEALRIAFRSGGDSVGVPHVDVGQTRLCRNDMAKRKILLGGYQRTTGSNAERGASNHLKERSDLISI
jgi:hypothetical protein